MNSMTISRVEKNSTKRWTHEERWNHHCEELAKFITTNNRAPRRTSPNDTEKKLAQWVNNNHRQHLAGTLSGERHTKLISLHPLVERRLRGVALKNKWETNLNRTTTFVTNHGHLPRKTSADPDEKSLFSWIALQVSHHKSGRLTAEQVERFNESHHLIAHRICKHQQEFAATANRRWHTALEDTLNFIRVHGKVPQRSAEPEENRLEHWIAYQCQLQRAGNLTSERLELLVTAHPLLKARIEAKTPDEKWMDRLQELTKFVTEHDRLPAVQRSGTAAETTTAHWMVRHATVHKRGKMPAERITAITRTPNLITQYMLQQSTKTTAQE